MSFFENLEKKIRKAASLRGFVCDCCGKEIFDYPKRRFCEACEAALLRNDGGVCGKCGRKTVAEGVCLTCKSKAPAFTFGVSPFVYRGKTAALINRIKNGNRRLAYFFGERMTATLLFRFPDLKTVFDGGRYALNEEEPLLILPVPMTEAREKERGFNQARELAEVIADKLESEGISVRTDFETLIKRRETQAQKRLGFSARAENVAGAFHVRKRKLCKDRTVLLVDDVMTTGATGSACAQALLNAGAKRVYFLVAASLPEQK